MSDSIFFCFVMVLILQVVTAVSLFEGLSDVKKEIRELREAIQRGTKP